MMRCFVATLVSFVSLVVQKKNHEDHKANQGPHEVSSNPSQGALDIPNRRESGSKMRCFAEPWRTWRLCGSIVRIGDDHRSGKPRHLTPSIPQALKPDSRLLNPVKCRLRLEELHDARSQIP